MEYCFVGSDSPFSVDVKWYIAANNEIKKVVKKPKKNKNIAQKCFAKFV